MYQSNQTSARDTITIGPYRLIYSANQDAPPATTASEQTLSAAILGRLPGTNIFRNTRDFSETQTIDGLVILRIDASLYFANTEFLKAKIREILRQHGDALKAIILDASAVNDPDASADTALHQISADFKRRDSAIYIAGVKGPVRKVMRRFGLYDVLGGDHFFFTIDAAVKRYLRTVATQSRKLSPDDTTT